MDQRELLKTALSALKLSIDVLMAQPDEKQRAILATVPPGAYISEWRHPWGLGYEYHLHCDPQLKEAFERGVRGGMPTLVNIYTHEKIQELIRQGLKA